eukprot:6471591-Amphidinium_carterae.2
MVDEFIIEAPANGDVLGGYLFGVQRASTHVSIEKHLSGTFKWAVTGSREVVLARITAVQDLMLREGVALGSVNLIEWFQALPAEKIRKLIEMKGFFWGTVQPAEVLYTPPAFITIEHVGDDDVFGAKMSVLQAESAEALDLYREAASAERFVSLPQSIITEFALQVWIGETDQNVYLCNDQNLNQRCDCGMHRLESYNTPNCGADHI